MTGKLDAINPQLAARICRPLLQWRRYDAQRQAIMREILTQLAARPDLSSNTRELVEQGLSRQRFELIGGGGRHRLARCQVAVGAGGRSAGQASSPCSCSGCCQRPALPCSCYGCW